MFGSVSVLVCQVLHSGVSGSVFWCVGFCILSIYSGVLGSVFWCVRCCMYSGVLGSVIILVC